MRKAGWFILCALLATLFACDRSSEPSGDVIARVNDEVLTSQEVEALLPPGKWDKMSATDRQAWVDDWKRLVLLSQMAKEDGLEDRSELQASLRNAAHKVRANAVIALHMQTEGLEGDALEKVMHEYYQTQYDKTLYKFELQRLTVHDSVLANKVMEEVKNGLSFYDIYSRHQLEGVAYQYGLVTPSMLPKELYKALSNAVQFEVVRSQSDGIYDLARYVKKEGYEATFDDPVVQRELREQVAGQKEKELVDELVRRRERESNISIEL